MVHSTRKKLGILHDVILFVVLMSVVGSHQSHADEPAASVENTTEASSTAAAAEPIVTDRPDFTESTDAVPPPRFQLEMGYTFSVDREHGTRTREHTAPEALLRIGLIECFELRLGWDGYVLTESLFDSRSRRGRRINEEDWTQGAADLTIGLKHKFAEQDGVVPHLGFIAETTLPTGSPSVSANDVEPNVVLLWAYDLSDTLSLAGNVSGGAIRDDSGHFFQSSASLSFAVAWTERLGSYFEYFGIYPNARESDCAHSFNSGITFLITNDWQLDLRAGVGLNEEAADFFSGIGMAMRF